MAECKMINHQYHQVKSKYNQFIKQLNWGCLFSVKSGQCLFFRDYYCPETTISFKDNVFFIFLEHEQNG